MKKKLAVFFPGVGYNCDKPLLYYTKKLAKEHGFRYDPKNLLRPTDEKTAE